MKSKNNAEINNEYRAKKTLWIIKIHRVFSGIGNIRKLLK